MLKHTFGKAQPLSQVAPENVPTRWIPVHLKRYLYAPDAAGHKRLILDRYEFLVYRLLRNSLESGDIFCRDSVRFRSFEDDLLPTQAWQAKDALLAEVGNAILRQPIREHLASLEQQLEDRLAAVNQRIAADSDHTHLRRVA